MKNVEGLKMVMLAVEGEVLGMQGAGLATQG
jgi:hypothetical protein